MMRKQTSLRKSKLVWGLALIAAGLILVVAGLLMPRLVNTPSFNPRLIPAAGVVLVGVGIAFLAQYATIRLDPQAGRQMLIQASDERFRLIRARAGNRAFWVSITMTYIVLLWVSLAVSGNIPALSDGMLSFFLVATVIVPNDRLHRRDHLRANQQLNCYALRHSRNSGPGGIAGT